MLSWLTIFSIGSRLRGNDVLAHAILLRQICKLSESCAGFRAAVVS
jgi:hypothetical protein